MQRGLGGAAFEPVSPTTDRELTLGPVVLTLIGCGLFGLCALCFMFGYSVGSRNAEPASTAALPPAATPAIAQPANPQSKPSAALSGPQPQQAPAALDSAAVDETGDNTASAPAATGSPEPAAHTVLASQPATAQPAPAAATIQPALGAQPAGIMVQIAAVSHPEDADVLVGALRKRGYAVAARRDPADGLLHVQIGPFANRTDANAMRQKLLNDGYNAIVQP